ncbi:MAG: nucleotide exchange factor GrpE [Huintestinicola sp.]
MAESEKQTAEETTETAAAAEAEAQAEESSADTAEETEVKSPEELLKEEVDKLTKELADEKEKYLRLDAEYYNYRTRSLKEKQDAYDNALIKSVTEILSVVDNFERALAAETEDATYKKGIEMIFKQYTDILKKLGVEEIDALGKPFDPNFHNAVTQVEDENFGENTVSQVFQKGYTLGKKVIRHAMVTVANP